MLYILLIMNMMMTMTFLFLNHPLSMGFILFIQTILISLITGMMTYSFWFSFILYLIMVGGMLILFMYMTSLASNELMKFSKKIAFMLVFILIISMILFIFIDKSMINSIMKFNNIELLNKFMFNLNENINSINLIYNKPNLIISFIMMNYLLLTLIMTAKITNMNMGPLRQKF